MLPGRQDRWQRAPRSGMLVIVAGIALAAFVGLALAIILAPAFVRFDLAVSAAIRAIDVPGLESFALTLTRLADFWPMFVITAFTAAILYYRGRQTSAITLVLSVSVGSLAGSVMREVFVRVRPALEVARIPIPDTYSFPSGHALAALLYFGSLVILIMLHERRLARAVLAASLCVLTALAIAFSRVYLGVHYLGDVIGSWLLGIAWLAVVVLVSARWGASSAADDLKPR